MLQLKVLICGGGIAGNAVAFWLSKMNHDVTLVERFPDLRATGLQVDLRGHGVEVLKRMGLEEAFRAKLVQEQGIEMINSKGKVKAWFPANRTGKGVQSFTTQHEIMRGDFVRLMHDATKSRVQYMFGTFVESIEQDDSSVEVLFSNGNKRRFDLLIGADGQGSHIRRLLQDGTSDPVHYLGQYMAYFTMPQEIQAGEEYKATSYIAPGERFIMCRRSNPHQMQVYISCNGTTSGLKDIPRGDVEKEKEAFAKTFHNAGWRSEEIIESMKQADDFYLERPGAVKLKSWSKGRVVLVGDAAYCPTANTGMGTTSALIGAYVLAGEIHKCCSSDGTKEDLRGALQAYDRAFRPFMDQVQRGIAENEFPVPTGPAGIAIMNFIMGAAAFFRIDVIGRFGLREKAVVDWSLPDYHKMVHATD